MRSENTGQYLSDEQRREADCIVGRMQRGVHRGLLRSGEPGAARRQLVMAPAAPTRDAKSFWRAPIAPPDFFGEVAVPVAPDALLKRLGRFPFWRGALSIDAALGPTYRHAVERGLTIFLGDQSP